MPSAYLVISALTVSVVSGEDRSCSTSGALGNQAVHVRAATVLPLKPHPVVGDTKYSDIVGLDEFHDSFVEEPVCDSWILNDSFGTACSGVRIVWAGETC